MFCTTVPSFVKIGFSGTELARIIIVFCYSLTFLTVGGGAFNYIALKWNLPINYNSLFVTFKTFITLYFFSN